MGAKIIKNEWKSNEEYMGLYIHNPTHGLKIVYIDNEDYDKCKEYRWNIQITRHGEFYVYAKINNKSVLIHRFIMDVTERETMVDHRNKKTLDNRKDNLRVCSNKENLCNVDKPINNTSGYKGVYWYPYRNFNKWMVSVKVDYKFINIGYYDKLEDAVKARNDAELKYYGEFARLQEFKG